MLLVRRRLLLLVTTSFAHHHEKCWSLPLVSREWKNGSNSGYNCTPFLHSLLTQGKEVVTANHQVANRVFSDSAGLWKKRGQNAGVLPAVAAPNGSPSFGRACSEQTVAALATFLPGSQRRLRARTAVLPSLIGATIYFSNKGGQKAGFAEIPTGKSAGCPWLEEAASTWPWPRSNHLHRKTCKSRLCSQTPSRRFRSPCDWRLFGNFKHVDGQQVNQTLHQHLQLGSWVSPS